MNSKLFFNEIRKIIREEVQLAMKQILVEGKATVPVKRAPSVQKPASQVKSSPTSVQDLLNETIEEMRREKDSERTLNFTSADAKTFGYEMLRERGKEQVPNTIVVGDTAIPTEVLDSSVVDALTKNYSSFMKKVNEKSKMRRESNG